MNTRKGALSTIPGSHWLKFALKPRLMENTNYVYTGIQRTAFSCRQMFLTTGCWCCPVDWMARKQSVDFGFYLRCELQWCCSKVRRGTRTLVRCSHFTVLHYRGTRMVVLVFTYEGVVSTVGRCITTGQMVRRQSVDSGYLRRE